MSKKPYIEVSDGGTPNTTVSAVPKSWRNRLGHVENITQAVLWVGLAGLAGVIVTACALVIDQMHFNNQTYRDQSSVLGSRFDELNGEIESLNEEIRQLRQQNEDLSKARPQTAD